MLNAALRHVFGDTVMQAGSAVNANSFRFDFSHGAPLTGDEVRRRRERYYPCGVCLCAWPHTHNWFRSSASSRGSMSKC